MPSGKRALYSLQEQDVDLLREAVHQDEVDHDGTRVSEFVFP